MKRTFNLANETLHVCTCACVFIGCERRDGEKEMTSTEGATETEDRGGQPDAQKPRNESESNTCTWRKSRRVMQNAVKSQNLAKIRRQDA